MQNTNANLKSVFDDQFADRSVIRADHVGVTDGCTHSCTCSCTCGLNPL